jgi:hypothetical protein
MRTDNDACSKSQKVFDSWQSGPNAAIVDYDSSIKGNVEIDTQQHALAG